MKIAVVGAGAIGGVVGGYLTQAGNDVTLVDIAKDHVEAMQQAGLTLEIGSQILTIPVKAIEMEQFAALESEIDLIILAVKGQHTEDALRPILHRLHPGSAVLSMQNGLCERVIASMVGEERTIGCFVNLFADYLEPGRIQYGGQGSLYIGELNGEISPRLEQVHRLLQAWGPAQMTDNIWGYLWSKLAYGAVLTATALVDETMANVMEPMENRELMFAVASETLAVAHRLRITPEAFDDWEPASIYPPGNREDRKLHEQWNIHIERLRSYKKVKSGIWRDLAVRKRKTEIGHQLSPVLEQAEQFGVEMPLTRTILSMIKDIEEGTRQMSWDNIQQLKQLHESGKKASHEQPL